jgi:serine phosphatase RsbU (regulator of sigma subunit)
MFAMDPPDVPVVRRRMRASVPWTLVALALLVVAFIGDVLTGEQVSLSLVYVLATAVASWFVGRPAGIAFATLGVTAWVTAYVLVGKAYTRTSVLYWNVLVESAIYFTAALVVARVRAGIARERDLGAQIQQAYAALNHEVDSAGVLQRELLSRRELRVAGYEPAIHYATSQRAGGDYYDTFQLDDGRLGIVLADASGHGVPAAVLMGMTLVLMNAMAGGEFRPDRLLAHVNDRLSRTLPPGWFVTACYAILDPPSGRLEYALAGHDPPRVRRAPDGRIETLSACGGPPLGLFPRFPEERGETVLAPGDTLILYTDGVTEAMSPTRELFGEARLLAALRRGASPTVAEMRRNVLDAVEAHAAGAGLQDDLTLLLLRRSVE